MCIFHGGTNTFPFKQQMQIPAKIVTIKYTKKFGTKLG